MYLGTKMSFDPRGFVNFLREDNDPDIDYFIDLISIVAELKEKSRVCDTALLQLMAFAYHVRPLITGMSVLDTGAIVIHCSKVRMKFSKDNTHLLPVWSTEGALA